MKECWINVWRLLPSGEPVNGAPHATRDRAMVSANAHIRLVAREGDRVALVGRFHVIPKVNPKAQEVFS